MNQPIKLANLLVYAVACIHIRMRYAKVKYRSCLDSLHLFVTFAGARDILIK